MSEPIPPLEYLLSCSEMSLRDLEIAALDRAAQCKKRATVEFKEAIAQQEAAGVARYFLEHRGELLDAARRTLEAQTVLEFPQRKRA